MACCWLYLAAPVPFQLASSRCFFSGGWAAPWPSLNGALVVALLTIASATTPFVARLLGRTAVTTPSVIAADLARSAGFVVRTEVALPGSVTRPADVLIESFDAGFPLSVDCAAVHPLPLSTPLSATLTAGQAAAKREAAKVAQSAEACALRSWGFVAFVGEATGHWGEAATRLLRRLVRAAAMRDGVPVQEASAQLWTSLSVAMARGVARQLIRGIGVS